MRERTHINEKKNLFLKKRVYDRAKVPDPYIELWKDPQINK